MRRPARVPDAARTREIEMPDRVLEAFDFALAMEHLQVAVLLDGDSRRIVAAILQALQALDENVFDGTLPGIPDDAAHTRISFAISLAAGA